MQAGIILEDLLTLKFIAGVTPLKIPVEYFVSNKNIKPFGRF
jgi:hypothetical protein